MAERGVILDRTTAERMARATKAYERQPVDMRGPRVPLRQRMAFWFAHLTTSLSFGSLNGRSIKFDPNPDAGGPSTSAFGPVSETDDVIIWDGDAAATIRACIPIGADPETGKQVLYAIPRGVFRVFLTQTGGTAGDKTNPVSFTYTVSETVGGFTLATDVEPMYPSRSQNGKKIAASFGLAWWNSGTLEIFAFEAEGTGACE
jgi:hypothetical protein